jgi:peptidoglycan-associated lipoprotein
MNTKQGLKIFLVALGLVVLAGCATNRAKDGGAKVSDATGASSASSSGVASSGLGQDDSLGGSGGSEGRGPLRVADQTYYYDFNRSDVRPTDKESIEVQAHYLAKHPNARVLIEGNTDPRGSREYNIGLGEHRAQAVADILMMNGAEKAQIRIVSYGAEKLATQGTTEDDYQKDRRANLVYEAKS